jgi:mannose/fructose/N-acetylgalactosamine-specific phosphotransferase system component IIC
MAGDPADKVIKASIALIILAVLGTLALQDLFSASMPSVPAAVTTLITVLVGILFAVGIALLFYRYVSQGRGE